jgi:RecB family exonuclease
VGLPLSVLMPDPQLALFSGSTQIASNDNWGGDPQLAATAASVGAFALPSATSKDAMLLVTLAPGQYTAQVSANGAAGQVIVEVYDVP